jgi:hypothetical protein
MPLSLYPHPSAIIPLSMLTPSDAPPTPTGSHWVSRIMRKAVRIVSFLLIGKMVVVIALQRMESEPQPVCGWVRIAGHA